MVRVSRCTVLLKNIWPSSAIQCVVGSLTPTIDANFRNVLDLPKSVLGSFRPLQESSQCVLSSNSFSLAYWNLHLIVLKHYICHNVYIITYISRMISDIQKIKLFPLSVQCKGLRLRFFDYILCLVSTPQPF